MKDYKFEYFVFDLYFRERGKGVNKFGRECDSWGVLEIFFLLLVMYYVVVFVEVLCMSVMFEVMVNGVMVLSVKVVYILFGWCV